MMRVRACLGLGLSLGVGLELSLRVELMVKFRGRVGAELSGRVRVEFRVLLNSFVSVFYRFHCRGNTLKNTVKRSGPCNPVGLVVVALQ